MFKDIHCHLLPGIDDGSNSIEESIEILRRAEKEGVSEIVLTPHYIENTRYNCNNKNKKESFEILIKAIRQAGINIKLYLGNENYMSNNFIELLNNDEIMTINNSRYLLFEFPLSQPYKNSKDYLYELVTKGYVPILAHPERYRDFQKNPSLVEEYTRMGILLQGNYKSLLGKYGRKAKKTLKILLKKDLITFLGSDIHHIEDYELEKAIKKIKRIVKDENRVVDILSNNFDKVITNKLINIDK